MPVSDQGNLSGRYAQIPRALVFITRGDQLLLIKGAAHKRLWAGRYNAIGGHIERGEDVLSAAQRELFEETGLSIDGLWLCGIVSIDTGLNPGILLFLFRGESHHGEVTASPEGELEWHSVTKLEQLALVEDIPLLLPRVLKIDPSDPPFYCAYHYSLDGKLEIKFKAE
jgi:8-oxo-dGTP diphosphatase